LRILSARLTGTFWNILEHFENGKKFSWLMTDRGSRRSRAFNYGLVVRDCSSNRARRSGWRLEIRRKIFGIVVSAFARLRTRVRTARGTLER
jgi:hypothetical protein